MISGASSGIGYETANFLAERGYVVYGLSRRDFETEKFNFIKCDVCKQEEVKRVFESIFQKEGQIDVLINNAGMGISGAIEYAPKKDVEAIFDVNVNAVINVSGEALKYLRKTQGRIINVSSVASVVPIPFQACYSATKAAVESFSFALSNEVKPQKVKICCVRPGDTKTGFTAARVKNAVTGDAYGDRIEKSVAKMEKDEMKGKDPVSVSKIIYKCMKKCNPPLVCTVGFGYKFLCVLAKLLPKKLVNYIVYKLY